MNITQEMERAAISAFEDATGDRLPDGDGEDHRIVHYVLDAALRTASIGPGPVAYRHLLQVGEGAFVWTRWLDYDPNVCFDDLAKVEFAFLGQFAA